ncbi:MAG: hypothetical protein NTW50_01945 [Candidatus Berkelbacteria bacterium]|nr:hypothetical protein [Candidatus Berkelbacteria bacterium]
MVTAMTESAKEESRACSHDCKLEQFKSGSGQITMYCPKCFRDVYVFICATLKLECCHCQTVWDWQTGEKCPKCFPKR